MDTPLLAWLSTILALLGFGYAFMMFGILIGNLVAKNRKSGLDFDLEPKVSVLIAAKDEEENISNCLESLLYQDYPHEKFQVVVVNDRSIDNTQSIIEQYIPRLENLICVNIKDDPTHQTGKQSALKEGIKRCQGEFILFTDADCIADPLWTRKIISRFSQEVGLVMGFSTTEVQKTKSTFFAKLQAFDLSFLLSIAAGCVGLGKPASCIGNNIACRKKALDEIGGFDSIGYTVTEDAALMQAIVNKTNWEVTCSYDPESVMITKPAINFRGFYNQRIRWLIGGQKACSWSIIPLQFVFLFHLSILIFSLFSAIFLIVPSGLIIAIGLKFSLDLSLAYLTLKRLRRTELLRFFLLYEAFLIFYTSVVGFGGILTQKVKWKDEYV